MDMDKNEWKPVAKPSASRRLGWVAFGLLMLAAGGVLVARFIAVAPLIPAAFEGPRESVTFIMGADRSTENRYYLNASWYFSNDSEARTDRVIRSCGSLREVRDYLAEKAPPAGRWGVVNIVVHGNPWTGISAPVLGDRGRTTGASLRESLDAGAIPPLPESVADERTEIRVLGCGVGRNPGLADGLREAFRTESQKLSVSVSDAFHLFIAEKSAGRIADCRALTANAWFEFYPRGYRPVDTELVARLKKRYPEARVAWKAALANGESLDGEEGGLSTRTFDIPVDWTVAYDDVAEIPDLMRYRDQQRWLASQPDLQKAIAALGLPVGANNYSPLHWTFMKVEHRDEAGVLRPAIRALGLCTVLAVLEAKAYSEG